MDRSVTICLTIINYIFSNLKKGSEKLLWIKKDCLKSGLIWENTAGNGSANGHVSQSYPEF
jgi:hypothetical protein